MGVITHNPLISLRRKQHWPWWASLCFVVACGPSHSDHPPEPSDRVPDYLSTLPDLQTLLPDSLAVSALRLASGPGPVLLTLRGGENVAIDYTLLSLDTNADAVAAYEQPLLLQPPVTVTARGQRGDLFGEESRFVFAGTPEYGGGVSPTVVRRIPKVVRNKASAWPKHSQQGPYSTAATRLTSFKLDGEPEAGDQKGRSYLVDALYDVPSTLGHIDIAWVNISEVNDGVRMAMQLRDAPAPGQFRTYGFEIGTSGIDTEKFGSGATYEYKVSLQNSGLQIEEKDDDTSPRLVDGAKVAVGTLVEMFVPFTAFPKLKAASHLAVRAYTLDWSTGVTVTDRMEPAFLRSPFAVVRSATPLAGNRSLAVDLHVKADLKDAPVVDEYFRLIPPVVKDLETLTGIPLYRTGAFPLFYVPSENRGYAGLNTTDRGTLTTLGPGTSMVAKTQLMAHEIAHLINARSSSLAERWLQEAHSEWIAERVLYRHFPTRTVYKFLRDLRYDRYFEKAAENEEFFLDDWGGDTKRYGYEKAFLFVNLLEQEVGTEILLAVFQAAVNVPFDSRLFQAELERRSGKDLDDLFSGWVYPGDMDKAFSADKWFLDQDGDGLLNIDELMLGLDPDRADTDSDGFADGEEFFDARDPLSPEEPLADGEDIRIVGLSNSRTNDLLRLQTTPGKVVEYSLVPGSANWLTSDLPGFVFPPWRVQARLQDEATSEQLFTRALYVGGELIPTPLPTEVFYPSTTLGSITVDDDFDTETSVILADSQADMATPFKAFNVTSWQALWAKDNLEITVEFAKNFDPHDFRGEITMVFDRITWSANGPDTSREFTFFYTNGTPYWADDSGGNSPVMEKGFKTTQRSLKLTIASANLAAWSQDEGDKTICLWTTMHLDGPRTFDDHAGCQILDSPGFNRYQARFVDHFHAIEDADHVVDLFLNQSDDQGNRAILIRDVAGTAVRQFERLLGRPIFERQHWPLHAYVLASGPTIGSARQLAGAYLAGRTHLWEDTYLYLVIEELARLHLTDLLARHDDPPYWVQELYIQWLAGGASYSILPTASVKNFHHARIDQYSCYVDQLTGCEDSFAGDIPLGEWTSSNNASTGSTKSLMFLLVLNATVGTETLAQVFSDFTNRLPSEAELLRALQSNAPTQSATLAALWTHWVEGSGSLVLDQESILSHFVDADADGLFLVEEQIRGSSDASVDTYP